MRKLVRGHWQFFFGHLFYSSHVREMYMDSAITQMTTIGVHGSRSKELPGLTSLRRRPWSPNVPQRPPPPPQRVSHVYDQQHLSKNSRELENGIHKKNDETIFEFYYRSNKPENGGKPYAWQGYILRPTFLRQSWSQRRCSVPACSL